MDNEDVMTFMRQGFSHLEEKIDDLARAGKERDLHYQTNFRELYNENKLQNERHTAEREKIMTEVDAKLDSLGMRMSITEKEVTTIQAERAASEKSRPVIISIVGLVMTALSVGSAFLFRAIGG